MTPGGTGCLSVLSSASAAALMALSGERSDLAMQPYFVASTMYRRIVLTALLRSGSRSLNAFEL